MVYWGMIALQNLSTLVYRKSASQRLLRVGVREVE